jgi:DNA-binding transcriptional LysR family regulator
MPIYTTAVRCFEEVARLGSIRRAAEHLNLTGSAVNRQVLRLEEELGTPLFERLPRGMRLSAAGEVLLASLRRQSHDLKDALAQFEALRGLRRGHVTISVLSYPSEAYMANFVADFRRDYPGITFTILSGNSEHIIRTVLDGTADLGFGYPPQRGVPLRRVAEWPTRFGAVMAPDHPLAGRDKVRLRDCIPYPILLPQPGMESRAFAEQCGLARWPDRNVVVESNSFPTLIALVRAGVGLGLMSEIDTVIEVARGRIVFVPLAEPQAPVPRLTLMVKADRTLPFATSVVLERLANDLQSLIDRARISRPGQATAP